MPYSDFCKTFQVLLNQMEENWFFDLILREVISFPVPVSRDAKLDEVYRRETLLRAPGWVPPLEKKGQW